MSYLGYFLSFFCIVLLIVSCEIGYVFRDEIGLALKDRRAANTPPRRWKLETNAVANTYIRNIQIDAGRIANVVADVEFLSSGFLAAEFAQTLIDGILLQPNEIRGRPTPDAVLPEYYGTSALLNDANRRPRGLVA